MSFLFANFEDTSLEQLIVKKFNSFHSRACQVSILDVKLDLFTSRDFLDFTTFFAAIFSRGE